VKEIRFDDIDALSAAVSEEFGGFGEPARVNQEMIDAFADLTGDRQWIHVDVERARRESPFGGPIAHGFLTLSLLPRLAKMPPVAVTGHAAAVNYGAESLRFLSPVPAGSELHARARLAKVEVKAGGTLVTTEWDVRVVGAEKPAILYHMQILYRA
jgi:acyl dehydratase